MFREQYFLALVLILYPPHLTFLPSPIPSKVKYEVVNVGRGEKLGKGGEKA